MSSTPSEFTSFELEHSLFEVRIDGVPIWERVRFHVFRQIKEQNGTGQAHTEVGDSWQDYIRGAGLFLKNLVINNPYFTSSKEIIYVGHHRRKKQEDGYWWDIYCDPIHDACDQDYIHLEKPHQLSHLRPARTANLRYLDLIVFGGTLQQMVGVNGPTIPEAEQSRLEDTRDAIRDQFDADVDLLSMAQEVLHVRQTTLPLYRRLLERVDPELAVVVVSYERETFIEACKEQGIPVIELQHGVIYENHFGYSYPGPRTKETFPDYLLTFGEFWNNAVEFPIPDDRVISAGYPYLEQSVDKYNETDIKDQLLFISQGTIGEQLSKFAVEVDQSPEIHHDIVYKLHPGEYDRWRTAYPWLVDTEIEVIDSSEPSLYQLFSKSWGQIGVYSTAIYEGLHFDLETYLYECSGEEILQPLLDNGTAKLVSSIEELSSFLASSEGTFDDEYYFAPNATENICEFLDRLRTDGTPFESSDVE